MRWSAVAAVALAVVGCAHDVNKWYLGKVTGDKTGTVVVKFSEVVSNA
jgi:hypothetical protein